MAQDSAVLQVRLDERLKQAFADAARRDSTTPSGALRALVQAYVRESRRKEAQRQSRLVDAAPDADETEALIADLQDLGDAEARS
jgi:antitoxin component of RelBE/YafQ-DinJ toxin-antitoxin module